MPVVFVHGVNTRDTDEDYQSALEARGELLERLVLKPLAARGGRFADIKIRNAYWGGHGVSFAWNLESLPDVSTLEHFGEEEKATPLADIEFAETARWLAGPAPGSSQLEPMGAADDLLTRAAKKDLPRFLETVLAPILFDEARLAEAAVLDAAQEGLARALLAIAIRDVARQQAAADAVTAASSDNELLDELKALVLHRFDELAAEEPNPAATTAPEGGATLEPLGFADWWQDVKDTAGELFDRAKGAPGRAATLPILQAAREKTHRRFSRFLGDVFVYLHRRGESAAPGKIVEAVLSEIKNAPRSHPDEPLIVITHSMGGNILYDILTHYDPTLKVDVWISVASQVAQFEEMKLFKESKDAIKSPQTVTGLKPRVGYWTNIYDPADMLAFKARPVFAEVDADLAYLTGASALKAHGEYFGRASFYDLIREHVEKAFPA